MNVGSSPYHAVQGLFCRDAQDTLLAVEGRKAENIAKHWSTIRAQVTNLFIEAGVLPSGIKVHTAPVDITDCESPCSYSGLEHHQHFVREIYHTTKRCYVGLLSCHFNGLTEKQAALRDWIETFFLLETTLWPHSKNDTGPGPDAHRITRQVTTLFETTLRNVSSHDEWDYGREHFFRRVLEFVVRGERIQMGVPAFPCKSPNGRKVGGMGPDMAERIALQTLHSFSLSVQEVYAPGAAIWIINDGHVFSDCIGADDQSVLDYDQQLQNTYRTLYPSNTDFEAIRFRGLCDMFFNNPDVTSTFSPSWISEFEVAHPINSQRIAEAETARQIMMACCSSSRAHFDKLIVDQHPSTVSLYRGQARFMQDDLATPDFLAKSSKQKKKTSFVVAAEMIARNQAYSNLLELLYPNFVRLSIHAHSNKGPKFGVCLFPRSKIRAIASVENRHELVPAYEFQVPTPWHNAIITVEGDSMLYLGKAEVARAAIENGGFEGGWVDGPGGGHFALRAISCSTVDDAVFEDPVPLIPTPMTTATSVFALTPSPVTTASTPISSSTTSTYSSGAPTATEGDGQGLGIMKTKVQVLESATGGAPSKEEKANHPKTPRVAVFCGIFDLPWRLIRRAFRSRYERPTSA
ncbi:Pyoverdine/dityrosine biosynthesis protein-domain-containing protein [Lophiotrema nucula]|uniref:Pyoverdine/dityrosine biosynthesis protein-domain-containing protein n=1 Tax=Lophiotrema nucula TaxID=690887 RepID=A0A6A5YQF2_9PLEO|nr:Pyoverdine/dityrosine biosynthesis protein-domain-containing protein [Lophiotrema nucula]